LMDSINAPMAETNAARSMLAKLNFPREALLLSGVYKTLFHAIIKVGLLLCILPFWGISPGWRLMLFPVGVLSLILAGTAVGLFITPVGMLYTDVGKALPLIMQFLMYASPVVFPRPETGMAAKVFAINPLTPLILTARDWLTGAAPDLLGYFLVINAVAAGVLILSWIGYRLSMPILIERIAA